MLPFDQLKNIPKYIDKTSSWNFKIDFLARVARRHRMSGGNGRKYPWHVARIGARGREAETKLGTDAHIRKLWFPWWASKPSLIIPSIFSFLPLSPNNFDCSPSKWFEFLLRPYPPRFAPFYFLQTWLESFHHIFWLRNVEAKIIIL